MHQPATTSGNVKDAALAALDADLAPVIIAWPTLPNEIRDRIVALVSGRTGG